MSFSGDEVRGEIHSIDASSGVEIILYLDGSSTVRVLQDGEFLSITDYVVISAPGGDLHFFIGEDSTPGAGETVGRGTVAPNGGIAHNFIRTPYTGIKDGLPFIVAPAGAVDVLFTGRISKV